MSVLLQCHRIKHSVGTRELFVDLDLAINEGDRIGLIGHNGSGKSTLINILNGAIVADHGDLSRTRGLTMETVEQFLPPALEPLTLFGALASKLPSEERDFNHYRVEMLLTELGFLATEFDYKVADLSGGQQNRLMFARAVINNPSLILFDEPTNHLDLQTLVNFENFLRALDAAYLVISHDREFLDSVTDRTLCLRDQRIYSFNVPCTEARQKLEEHDAAETEKRKTEEKKIRSLKASAKRIAIWGREYDNEKLARKAKSMEKRVEKLEAEKTFVTKGSGLKLDISVQHTRANRVLQIQDQDVSSPGGKLFHIDDFFIRPGDRVALLGANGAGKTTLINLIMENYAIFVESGAEREVRFNPRTEIGYYDQELEGLDPGATLLSSLVERCPPGDHKAALIKAGFPYKDVDKPVDVLSGGEKARLMFLMIKLNQPNFLVLDEPTNHIDIEGKEELEAQILESNATVLLTSHDRRFMDNITDRFLMIDAGALIEINDPAGFYEKQGFIHKDTIQADETHATTPVQAQTGEDATLKRIVELEELLAADKARKPKFQKPKLQVKWQAELTRLMAQL